jgi:rhodanese-related sulfurtransferase
VAVLKSQGFNNAAALLGGFEEWKREGFPIDKKQ